MCDCVSGDWLTRSLSLGCLSERHDNLPHNGRVSVSNSIGRYLAFVLQHGVRSVVSC